MTTLFLQRIEISNFRAYGDNFSLSLPGPGVTILAGPRGLGKSSFFEAIEWALTGRVYRLEALTQESLDRGRNNGLLARREGDEPVAQYGVSLEFVNGEGESRRIERRAVREQESRERFAEVLSPTQQQVIDLLRADSWLNEISDLGEYLRLTHLRGPAGTDKIDLAARRSRPGATRVSAKVITEKAIAIAAALNAILGVEVALESALPPAGMLARLAQAMEQAAAGFTERRRVLSRAEETLNAWQQLNSALAEARARHAASHAGLVGREGRLRAALEVDEQRRGAESKSETLLRLSAARKKIAEGTAHKASATSRIDRYTHELWMVQTYLRDAKKAIQQLASAQLEGDRPPDLESLNDHRARLMARTDELSLAVKNEHEVVAQVEQELLAAHALQQQYPELLSALGTLPSEEANAIDEAVRAVEQLAQHERQLVQSEEPFPSALGKLNEEITQAQAALAQEASEAQNIERQIANLRQRWVELGLQGFPDSLALYEQRNTLAEQESKLQELREQEKHLADAWLAWQNEEELPESPPSVDAVALLLSKGTAYQWSRWPALLLDEPLQPHDRVHTEAFIEVLRNLARDRNYQVILSTHDEELAADIGRKMEEAGIKCVICRYRGLGPTGALHSTG